MTETTITTTPAGSVLAVAGLIAQGFTVSDPDSWQPNGDGTFEVSAWK